MKKIILLLNLIAFTAISQVTPVGGYLPLNSSKSFTAGNATCSNVIARGTFSVGSTATITGVLTTNSVVANTGQLRLYSGTNSDLILRAVGASQAITGEINGAPKFQVNSSGATVTGSLITTGTHSLGSANLTGGNTGTVAVLSDVVFPVTFNSSAGTNPADATTYYFGNTGWSYNTNSSQGIVTLPYNCTLVSWNYDNLVLGTLGSAEACTVQVSGTTTLNLSSAITLSSATSNYTGTVNTNFTAGDQINIKFIAPTWGTNPTTLVSSMVLWFIRRS